MRRPVLLALAALATVAAVAAGLSVRYRSDDVPTIEVRRSDFVHRVVAEGNLRAVERTPLIVTTRSGRRPLKVAWMVPDGSRVSAGDVVVRFDPTDLEQELEQGRDQGRIVGRRVVKATVERDGELENLDRDADQARRELETAETFQATDTELYSRNEIIESEIDTELVRARADHADTTREIKDQLSRTDLELLEIQRRQATLKVDQAEEGLAELELHAPHDGIITYERDWRGNILREGDTAYPGRPIATIPDLDRMEAEVYVLEADAGGLAAGQRASVVIEAHPESSFSGAVSSVAPVAQRRLRWVPVQYFQTVLELEETRPEIMKPGQRVRAEIVLAEVPGAITVPRHATVERDGATIVFRRVSGGFEPVEVELGAAALGRVVVTSGLEEGDVIALRDPEVAPADAADEAPTRAPGLGR